MKDRILNLLMLLAVAAALAVTWLRDAPEQAAWPTEALFTDAPAPAVTASPGQDYRARRAESRRRERELLLKLMDNAATDENTRALAEEQLLQVTAREEIELAVEAALAARGDADALCEARQGAMTVFVSRPLDAREAALLLEIAMEASGLSGENIRFAAF